MRKFEKKLKESGESCLIKPTRQDGDNSLCVGDKEDDTDAKFQMVKHALAFVSSSKKNRTCEQDEWIAKFIIKTITLPEQNIFFIYFRALVSASISTHRKLCRKIRGETIELTAQICCATFSAS